MPVLEREQQETKTGRDFAASVVLHVVIIGGIIASGFFFNRKGDTWGDSLQASSISATAVSAIPLPPRQPQQEENVLATEKPSPAPVETKEKTEEAPSPKDIPVLEKKPEKKPKEAPKQQAVQKPQPTKPQPDRAQTGEAGGVRIAMSAVQTRNGIVGIGVSDSAFGARFAYYVTQMKQKISQQWYSGALPPSSHGRRVYYSFRIARDGSVSQVQLTKSSGDSSLDTSAVRALQRIETFGPLPDGYSGRYLDVQFYFEPPQ